MWLRQSTASQEILLGRFVDSTDGDTEETALTIANTDIKLWKEGATAQVNKNSGGATHDANAMYYTTLDATDTNTLGKLEVNVHVAGALSVKREFMVVPANVYDSLILGTDTLNSAVTEWNGTALGTTNPLPNAAAGTAGGLPTDSTGKTSFNDPTANAVRDAILNAAISGYLSSGTVGLYLALAGGVLVDTTVTGTPTSTTLQLTAGSTVDDFYDDQLIYIISGTGIGQARPVLSYVGATKTITIDEAWAVTPAASDRVVILSTHNHPITQIRDQILADGTAFNGADIAAILTDTGTDIPALLTTIDTVVDAIKATTDNLPDSGALTTINSQIVTIDTIVDAIKAKTDSLTFTKAGEVDANTQSINDVTITGDGSATPFDV